VFLRVCVYVYVHVRVWVCVCVCVFFLIFTILSGSVHYGVALVSRIDKIIGLFCKSVLYKRQYSAKEPIILSILLAILLTVPPHMPNSTSSRYNLRARVCLCVYNFFIIAMLLLSNIVYHFLICIWTTLCYFYAYMRIVPNPPFFMYSACVRVCVCVFYFGSSTCNMVYNYLIYARTLWYITYICTMCTTYICNVYKSKSLPSPGIVCVCMCVCKCACLCVCVC